MGNGRHAVFEPWIVHAAMGQDGDDGSSARPEQVDSCIGLPCFDG